MTLLAIEYSNFLNLEHEKIVPASFHTQPHRRKENLNSVLQLKQKELSYVYTRVT